MVRLKLSSTGILAVPLALYSLEQPPASIASSMTVIRGNAVVLFIEWILYQSPGRNLCLCCLVSLFRFLLSILLSFAAFEGRVAILAFFLFSASCSRLFIFFITSSLLASWVRCAWLLTCKNPSELMRFRSLSSNNSFCALDNKRESCTLKLPSAAVSTLLTFCPPF